MKRWAKILGLVLAAVFLGLQLVPVDRANPPVLTEIVAPPEVAAILERSCYDCHSNKTRWPWYSRVAPVSWWVAKHVRQGRGDLNFTEWPLFDTQTQQYHLGEMKSEIKGMEMPLPSYLWIHRGARLDAEERGRLVEWIDDEVGQLSLFGAP